jgi:hypothetical protein
VKSAPTLVPAPSFPIFGEVPHPDSPSERAVLAALRVYLASPEAIADDVLPEHLLSALASLPGVDRKGAMAAGRLALSKTMAGRTRHGMPLDATTGSLTRRVRAEEPDMRARYILAASRRLTAALNPDDASGVAAAFVRERGWADAHVQAGRRRRAAAAKFDAMAKDSGPYFVWACVMDQYTTPDCAALNGRIFTADNPPGIPGAMHARCRCTAHSLGARP